MWYMTEERQMLQKMMQEFVENEVKPFVPKMEQDEEYPREIIRKLGEMGILGLSADVRDGGVGKDFVSFGIALEEISKESTALTLLVGLDSDFVPAMMGLDVTEEQRQKWVIPAIHGEKIIAGYVTEPCGFDNFAEFETVGVPDGEGGWIINGTKILGTNNGIADYVAVLVRTGEFDPLTLSGFSMFVIPSDTPGVKFGRNENKLGWHGSNTGTLYLDNVHVGEDCVYGKINEVNKTLYMQYQTQSLTLYGPMVLGACERVWQQTRKLLSERKQQGVSLWDKYQHIRCTMAQLWMKIENYRGAVYSTLEDRNRGENVLPRAIALKCEGVDLLTHIARQCITMNGGMGTVVETELERFYRDAPMMSVGCGSIMTFADTLSMMI